ncbi:hypothetical protein [Undibacterium rugosum]|uniref:hypothetical protein n=1 Tax=Undibacterium rugosum TaxID=2762291 RepID=UPI001B83844F|nr:hypothetical protein [Undibacterium rugosum]MBR7780297.1 hypothetical protein [Undibacterium rugosum]
MKRITLLCALTLAGVSSGTLALTTEPANAEPLWQNTLQYVRASSGWVAGSITSAYLAKGNNWKEQADLVPTARLQSWENGEPVRKTEDRSDKKNSRTVHISSAIANHPELILADCPLPKRVAAPANAAGTVVFQCKIETKAVNYTLTTRVDQTSGRPLRVTVTENETTAQIDFSQNTEGISLPTQLQLAYRPANEADHWTITMHNEDWQRKPEQQINTAIQPAFLRLTEIKMQIMER